MNKVIDVTVKHSFATWGIQNEWSPIEVIESLGSYFIDADKNKILDFSSQLLCVNLGHCNKEITESIVKYLNNSDYVNPIFTTKVKSDLLDLLYNLFNKDFFKFFLPSSGTEANEAAIKIAKLYTGKEKVISRKNSYHGSTSLSLSISGDIRREYYRYENNDVYFVSNFHNTHSIHDNNTDSLDELRKIIENDNNIACFVMEPVVGGSGVFIPTKEYLEEIKTICNQNGIVLIFDEVACGWGRTGSMFAYQNWGVVPDILTTAKGITNGVLPLGLTAVSQKISDFFTNKYFPLGHTYESHPVVLSAAISAIKEYNKINFDLIIEKSSYIFNKLKLFKTKYIIVKEIRGIGLFFAIEFNTSDYDIKVKEIAKRLLNNKLLIYSANSYIIIAPSLLIEKSDLKKGLQIINKILRHYDKKYDSRK